MGTTITSNFLKSQTDSIGKDHCQWTLRASNWTTKSDHCEERAVFANFTLICQTCQSKLINHQHVNINTYPHNGIWRGF
jgi:predicted component of type VI protein secretion system